MNDESCMLSSLQSIGIHPRSAGCHTVSDRSFLSRVLAVLLSAALGWPGSGYPGSIREQDPPPVSGVSYAGMSRAQTSRAFSRRPGLERHQGPVNRVFDDDPAMLGEDSGEWVGNRAGTIPLVFADSGQSVPIVGALPQYRRDALFRFQCEPFHGLNRFRC